MKWHKRISLAIKIAFAVWIIWNFYNKLVKLLYNIKKSEVKKYIIDKNKNFYETVDNILHPGKDLK
jgi:hypothetical protein